MADIKLGRSLGKLRELTGLTLNEAADKLGFPSYQTLSKKEKGEREVKASELPLFAKIYYCSLSSLLGEKVETTPAALLWRNPPEKEKKKKIERQIFYLCEQYHLLETLLGLKEEEKFRFLSVSKDELRTNRGVDRLADNTIKLIGLGKRPAFSLQKVLEQEFGVKILYLPLSSVGSAASMIHDEFGAIVVINSDEAPWRRNYDFAHELFHLITWNAVSLVDLQDSSSLRDDIERKADRFASNLLLPGDEIKEEISKRLEKQKTFTYSDIVDISREFGVSTAALLYRMANLGFIEWEYADKIAKEVVARDGSIRRKEWGERPVSERFYFLAVRCLRKGLISRGKFSEIVEVDRSAVDEFVNNFGLMETEGATVKVMAS